MPLNKFLAIALMALFSLLPFNTAVAQTKDVWISNQVKVGVTLGNSLSGQTISFNLQDASGKSLGQATVPAEQALGSSLAQFFQSVADAIRELLDPPAEKKEESTAKNDDKKVILPSNQNNGGGTGGGGGCDPNIASCT